MKVKKDGIIDIHLPHCAQLYSFPFVSNIFVYQLSCIRGGNMHSKWIGLIVKVSNLHSSCICHGLLASLVTIVKKEKKKPSRLIEFFPEKIKCLVAYIEGYTPKRCIFLLPALLPCMQLLIISHHAESANMQGFSLQRTQYSITLFWFQKWLKMVQLDSSALLHGSCRGWPGWITVTSVGHENCGL